MNNGKDGHTCCLLSVGDMQTFLDERACMTQTLELRVLVMELVRLE